MENNKDYEKYVDTAKNNIDDSTAQEALKSNYSKAEELLHDSSKMERFLQRLEKKLKKVPVVGKRLAVVPIMASLIRSYVKKEYTDIPIGTIIAIVSALIYFVSPIDLVPDSIPVIGYFDDAAVVGACWLLVESDVEEYDKWRNDNGKKIDI